MKDGKTDVLKMINGKLSEMLYYVEARQEELGNMCVYLHPKIAKLLDLTDFFEVNSAGFIWKVPVVIDPRIACVDGHSDIYVGDEEALREATKK